MIKGQKSIRANIRKRWSDGSEFAGIMIDSTVLILAQPNTRFCGFFQSDHRFKLSTSGM